MRLSDFPGNAHIKAVLQGMFRTDRLPHAIIIEGERGLGRHAICDIICAAAVCKGEETPCYTCNECSLALRHIHPDITRISPDGANIKVDAVRRVRQDAYILPNQAEKKVFVIDGAEKMNESAQNALLKVLEEPPAFAMFILITESVGALLSTIVSRSVTLSLMPLDDDTMTEFILKNHPEYSREDIVPLLASSGGNIGQILAELKSGEKTDDISDKILSVLERGDELEVLKAFQPLVSSKKREETEKALRTLSLKLQRLISDKASGKNALSAQPGGKTALKRLIRAEADVAQTIERLTLNPNIALLLTNLSACLMIDLDV